MKIEGVLDDWFETGFEGSAWVILEDGVSGMTRLHLIEKGDHLTVFAPNGEVVFEGIIEPDSTIKEGSELGYRAQPTSHGRWIHWYQKGINPDTWGGYFFPCTHRATLVRTVQ